MWEFKPNFETEHLSPSVGSLDFFGYFPLPSKLTLVQVKSQSLCNTLLLLSYFF